MLCNTSRCNISQEITLHDEQFRSNYSLRETIKFTDKHAIILEASVSSRKRNVWE